MMKIAIGMGMFLCAAIGGIAGANVSVASSDEEPPRAPNRQCNGGVTLGMTEWLVYGCNDNRTLVFIAAPGSAADPYYFTVFPQGTEYHLFGEGTGDRQATDAAFKEIELFTTDDIRGLIAETKLARAQ